MPADEHKPIRVVVYDPETNEKLGEEVIENNYVLVTAGSCYLHHTQMSGTTHVLTVKGRKEKA